MRRDLEVLTVGAGATVRDAIAQIDRNRVGMVMVADPQNTLLGTATDGDIRRAMLAGRSLEDPIETIMAREPTVIQESTPEEERRRLMRERRLRHLPVLSEDGVVVGLSTLDELVWAEAPRSAVLMAGGMGTRLRPLTEDTPKPLLPVGGQPILERIVEHLKGAGVGRMVITTRYLAEQVEEHFGDGEAWGVDIGYIRERERRGTAGALRDLVGEMDAPFLVMNGDLLTDVAVERMFAFHKEHGAKMTVAVRHYTFQVPFGVVEVDGARIQGLSEKPTYDFFVNAGIYIVEPEVLGRIPGSGTYDITELIEELAAAGETVVSFPMYEQWVDIGRPEDLERAQAMFAPKRT